MSSASECSYVRVAVHLERVLLLLPERINLGLGLDFRLLQALAAFCQSTHATQTFIYIHIHT